MTDFTKYTLEYPVDTDEFNITEVEVKNIGVRELKTLDKIKNQGKKDDKMLELVTGLSTKEIDELDLCDITAIGEISSENMEKTGEIEYTKSGAIVKLGTPLPCGDENILELTFKRVNRKAQKRASNVNGDMARVVKLISDSANILPTFVESMSIGDFMSCAEVMENFTVSSR